MLLLRSKTSVEFSPPTHFCNTVHFSTQLLSSKTLKTLHFTLNTPECTFAQPPKIFISTTKIMEQRLSTTLLFQRKLHLSLFRPSVGGSLAVRTELSSSFFFFGAFAWSWLGRAVGTSPSDETGGTLAQRRSRAMRVIQVPTTTLLLKRQ